MSDQLEKVRADVRKRIAILTKELNKALEDAYVVRLGVSFDIDVKGARLRLGPIRFKFEGEDKNEQA